jgi:hypothetical protein
VAEGKNTKGNLPSKSHEKSEYEKIIAWRSYGEIR